ncbi:MAG: metallophosphoesterase, partial [Aquincola tertiaricarbonis]
HARWALLAHGTAGWRVELHHTPYDHEAAARRAEAGGRPDWADALRSGRVGRTEASLARTDN